MTPQQAAQAAVRSLREPHSQDTPVASALRQAATSVVQQLLHEAAVLPGQAEAAVYYTPVLMEVVESAIKFYLQAVGTSDGALILLPGGETSVSVHPSGFLATEKSSSLSVVQ